MPIQNCTKFQSDGLFHFFWGNSKVFFYVNADNFVINNLTLKKEYEFV